MKRLMPVVFFALVLVVTLLVPLSATGDEGRADDTATPTAPAAGDSGGVVEEGYDGDGPAPRDQQILDDLIVDGSLCVGFDCVNGESFGFDTLRLKENNLRIHFQDTSTSASFPSTDWRIVINDTNNGGGKFFGIEDADTGRRVFKIEANAPTDAVRVDDAGRLGLGTANPVVDVHVVSGNTPTLRLDQDGSSGFTPQVWDVAGNEANFFIRDATNGSALPFKIIPGNHSNVLVLRDGGASFGVNATADEEIHIQSTSPRLKIEDTDGAGNAGAWKVGVNNAGDYILQDGADDVMFRLFDDGKLRLQPQASAPAGGNEGDIYFDSRGDGSLCFFSNGTWQQVFNGGPGATCG